MENYSADVILSENNEVIIQDKHGKFNVVEEMSRLKKLTDPEFAHQCKVDELLEEYKKYVDTNIWYEAAHNWLDNKIDNLFLRWESMLQKTSILSCGFTGLTIRGFDNIDDFTFKRKNGTIVSFDNMLNDNPEVVGYEFEKYVIKYAKEKNSSSI